MPVLTRTQHRLSTCELTEGRMSTDSNDTMGENLWFIDAEYDGSQQDLTFPSTPLGKTPSRKDSLNNLRINTYPKADLPERYNSDEEERSPSPESDTASGTTEEEEDDGEEDGEEEEEEELKHKNALKPIEEDNDIVIYEDYSAEVAVAVPIKIMGPPKLIDITNLAPMHRRKRTMNSPTLSRAAMKNAVSMASRSPALSDASRSPAISAPSRNAPLVPTTDENAPPSKVSTPTTAEHLPKRQDSLPDLQRAAPDSWLPEEDTEAILESVEERDTLYFPALDVRPPPTYNDYDPYSLHPPSLSPNRPSHGYKSSPLSPSFPTPILKKQPGSIARARKSSNPPSALHNTTGGWKGLTRTLSMAKRQEASHPQAKKPKMIARGPTERQEMPSIPPFPFEEKLGNRVTVQAGSLITGSTTALSLKS